MRGKHNKLGEGERKARLGQNSLPNIAISVAETSGNLYVVLPRPSFGAKMVLSLNGVDPSCMNSITGSTCRAKCSNIFNDR